MSEEQFAGKKAGGKRCLIRQSKIVVYFKTNRLNIAIQQVRMVCVCVTQEEIVGGNTGLAGKRVTKREVGKHAVNHVLALMVKGLENIGFQTHAVFNGA